MPTTPKVYQGTQAPAPVAKQASVGVATSQIINEWDEPMVMVDGFPIDAAVTEDHAYDNEVTDFPVERGADITDHVRPKPLRITMEGFITGTPIGNIIQHSTRKSGVDANGNPIISSTIVDNGLDKLVGLRNNPSPITITTSLNTYQNMILSTLSIPREPGEAYQIHFKATFVQVTIITNNRTTIRTAIPGGQPKDIVGQKIATLGQPYRSVPVFTITNQFTAQWFQALGKQALAGSDANHTYFSADPSRGTPPADGVWVLFPPPQGMTVGYHSFAEIRGLSARYDPSTQTYVDKNGKTIVSKGVDPKVQAHNYNLANQYAMGTASPMPGTDNYAPPMMSNGTVPSNGGDD